MYAELKCRTNFSFLDGASHPEELVVHAANIGLNALAISDKNGVYGIPKAYWKIKDNPSMKLIVGSEIVMADHPPLTLLCRDKGAYAVMCQTLTTAHAGKEKGKAVLQMHELARHLDDSRSKQLICIAPQGSNYAVLKELLDKNLYIPVSRFKDGHDKERESYARDISYQFGLDIVVTNDVLYHEKSRRPLQDSLVCIREGTTLSEAGFKLRPNGERYLKSPFEMRQLFKDWLEPIEKTLEIADSCTFSPGELRYRYPSEWIPSGMTPQGYLTELVWKGANERYKNLIPSDVEKQLKHELQLIEQLNFADYFLTIYEIVDFARTKDILCQGRGSAANSAICYCLGITAVDPVRMNLLFERFISVERKEPPDIDVDFEHERREEVIQHIYEKYGRNRAAMVSAIVTYQKRSTFRELSKAFGVDVGTLSAKKVEKNFDELAKSSPIKNCKEQIPILSEQMAGFPRHISIHSGGFTLSADPITEIVPVEPARMEGRTIIQWDKYDLDYLGLLKVDVLALGMLSALKRTLDLAGMKLHEIPAEDKDTYKMIQIADTVGTFQVESRAQMNMSGRLMPKSFYDLVVQVAIVRPGPIVGKMVHPYLKRRHGLEPVVYPHPKLKDILGRTLGVPLFQEQVMKIAIELGGFTPGEADTLRRAIGAWRASGSIQKVGEKLLEGLKRNNIPDDYAALIFEQLKGFAHYGFPESHAASFALLSYASCYLKRHYPAEFACALINSQPMGFYAVHTIIDDAKRHGVKVLPVDPNKSAWDCEMENGSVRLGLRVVKGLAKKEAQTIIDGKPYKSLEQFLGNATVREDVLFRLAMGDAFNSFGADQRHTLWQILSDRTRVSDSQLNLFTSHSYGKDQGIFKSLGEFEAISNDYDAYSSSTKGHPMESLRKIKNLPKMTTYDVRRVKPNTLVTTSGLLLVRQRPPTANGVTFAAIEDEHGFLDMTLFAKEYEKYKEVFLNNCFLIVTGVIQRDGHSINMLVKKVQAIWENEATDTDGLIIEPTQYF